ncbi:MAG: hypothetical protein MUE81_16180 [Thermoflexibacter sp.]|jgi:hypothetical protein|nr:hypothetical protein [Thermoflexibacter sp.]
MEILRFFLFISLFFACFSCKKEKFDEIAAKDFLSANHAPISQEIANSAQVLLPTQLLQQNRVFLTGERHGIYDNQLLQFAFLKFLKEKAGVKYLLHEGGYAASVYYNLYLENGNEQILDMIFSSYRGTFEYSKSKKDFWKNLYQYNAKLPENERIIVLGLDVEHQRITAYRLLYELTQNRTLPQEIEPIIRQVRLIFTNQSFGDSPANESTIKNLVADISAKRAIYEGYLGNRLFDFELSAQNLLYTFDTFKNNGFNTDTRENAIWQNFLKLAQKYPQAKFYGQFGGYHVQQQSNGLRMAALIQHSASSPVRGQVLSIQYTYQNCFYLDSKSNTPQAVSSIANEHLFAEYTKTNWTLFRLIGEQSPFSQSLIQTNNDENRKEGTTTDYFQYMVVIKNSLANEPF